MTLAFLDTTADPAQISSKATSMTKPGHRAWKRTGSLVAVLLAMTAAALPAQPPDPELPFAVPPVASLKRVARPGGLSREEARTSRYILRTEPHPVQGDAYVVVTDHRDDAY